MKSYMQILLVTVVGFLLSVGLTAAASQPPAVGGKLPEIALAVPPDVESQLYLGLSGKQTFVIPEIDAEVVLIEIFSMY